MTTPHQNDEDSSEVVEIIPQNQSLIPTKLKLVPELRYFECALDLIFGKVCNEADSLGDKYIVETNKLTNGNVKIASVSTRQTTENEGLISGLQQRIRSASREILQQMYKSPKVQEAVESEFKSNPQIMEQLESICGQIQDQNQNQSLNFLEGEPNLDKNQNETQNEQSDNSEPNARNYPTSFPYECFCYVISTLKNIGTKILDVGYTIVGNYLNCLAQQMNEILERNFPKVIQRTQCVLQIFNGQMVDLFSYLFSAVYTLSIIIQAKRN
eukprot:TRINITY_DN12697_c1_g1_i1.p1 TRINITY_DN12697_c1_g1~~TRINITY_DN12697_c1_g1_i1.p1  ORF type:complete len:270 (-),score=22.74 TRINITY_DN12697_c1_g1_i1:713-1522(-)